MVKWSMLHEVCAGVTFSIRYWGLRLMNIRSARAVTRRLASQPRDPSVDDQRRAATAFVRVNENRLGRTVTRARSTFHAGVIVNDFSLSLLQLIDAMRAYDDTHPATDTGLLIYSQYRYPVDIPEHFHLFLLIVERVRPTMT
jgi:hypothetical protein